MDVLARCDTLPPLPLLLVDLQGDGVVDLLPLTIVDVLGVNTAVVVVNVDVDVDAVDVDHGEESVGEKVLRPPSCELEVIIGGGDEDDVVLDGSLCFSLAAS